MMLIAAATPIFAGVIMSLVLVAFRRSALSFEDTATTDLMSGVFWVMAAVFARTIYWAVPLLFTDLASEPMFLRETSMANSAFELVMIFGGLRLLRGILLLLPDDERADYNVWTVAFYPRRLRLRLSREREQRNED